MNLDDSLHETQRTIGHFEDNAQLAQAIKFALRRGKNWNALPMESKEALELIASNIAAILTGDSSMDVAHWNAIAIMARLRSKALETSSPSTKVAGINAVQAALEADGTIDPSNLANLRSTPTIRHIGEVLNKPPREPA